MTQSHQIHNSFSSVIETETDTSLEYSEMSSNLQYIEVQNFNQSGYISANSNCNQRCHNFKTNQKCNRYNTTDINYSEFVNNLTNNSSNAHPNTVESIDISFYSQNQFQNKTYKYTNKLNNDNIIDTSSTIDIIKNNHKFGSKTGFPYNINFKLANSLANQTLKNIIHTLLEHQHLMNNDVTITSKIFIDGIYHHIQNNIQQSSNCHIANGHKYYNSAQLCTNNLFNQLSY